MKTEQATIELGKIWMLGGFDAAAAAIERVKASGRNWDWPGANDAMRQAYAAMGASAPDVALTAIHDGEHPVQIAADKFWAK